MSTISRQSCRDTINNISQIYGFLTSSKDTSLLLSRFRLWPLVFIPQTRDIGDFLFSDEVFWQDPESLLSVTGTTKLASTQRTALQPYYGANVFFQRFFIDIFQVKQEPTLDDYLPLLRDVSDKQIDYIWKCIKVITRIAFAQNKQAIVKGIIKTHQRNELQRIVFI
jgi:hypothetical protein